MESVCTEIERKKEYKTKAKNPPLFRLPYDYLPSMPFLCLSVSSTLCCELHVSSSQDFFGSFPMNQTPWTLVASFTRGVQVRLKGPIVSETCAAWCRIYVTNTFMCKRVQLCKSHKVTIICFFVFLPSQTKSRFFFLREIFTHF